MNKSRSDLYSLALQDYLARHTPDRVTDAMNSMCAELDEKVGVDDFVAGASRRILERSQW